MEIPIILLSKWMGAATRAINEQNRCKDVMIKSVYTNGSSKFLFKQSEKDRCIVLVIFTEVSEKRNV